MSTNTIHDVASERKLPNSPYLSVSFCTRRAIGHTELLLCPSEASRTIIGVSTLK